MTMLERVARAICARNWDGDSARYDDLNDSQRADFLADARAAITALREPSEAVRLELVGLGHGDLDAGTIDAHWQAAIAAILDEKPENE